MIPRDLFQTDHQSPHQYQFSAQGGISNLCSFVWYDWCYYREEGTNLFPKPKELLGIVLGPAKNEGNKMAQNVLTSTGHVVLRRSVRQLTLIEEKKESEKIKRSNFDKVVEAKLGTSITLPPNESKSSLSEAHDFDFDSRENDSGKPFGWLDGDPLSSDGTPAFENSLSDTLINSEVLLPQGEELVEATVKGRHVNEIGQVLGRYHPNPTLNSIVYDVAFPDGAIKQCAANTIADALYSTINIDGKSETVLDCILEYSKNDKAVSKADKYIHTKGGNCRLRKTIVGWKILVRWRNQSESWIPLKLMKENYPVETSEYAKAGQLIDEPTFQ